MTHVENWPGFVLKLVATLARAWGLRRLPRKTHALGERGYVRGGVLKQSLMFRQSLFFGWLAHLCTNTAGQASSGTQPERPLSACFKLG